MLQLKKLKLDSVSSFLINLNQHQTKKLLLVDLMNLIMELCITDNGQKMASEKAKASRFGRMAASTKDTGEMTKLMDTVG